ncbi:MAG: 3-phosphoshikimate 1-carboxyvinyltransferase [Fusobacteriales bacterium]|nr:MAG: 3-phosphoshikimate 1-carboxyvinyltransferase [Fusobacteriales bacterium]
MKKILIKNKKLMGEITPPPSKSILHRHIIASSLAEGISKISNINFSEDILATIEAMRKLGANIEIKNDSLIIEGINNFNSFNEGNEFLNSQKNNIIDCNESGSTLRFLIPLFLARKNKIEFTGKIGLFKRPVTPYFEIFEKNNINYEQKENYLFLAGELKSGIFEIEGNISSQFITGLLFTLPLLKENSKIIIKGNLESKSYVDLTLDCLEKFGIKIKNNNYFEFFIEANQKYVSKNIETESDFSQAAFYLVANSIGSNIKIKNLNLLSKQGDKKIIEFLEEIDNFKNKNKTLYLDAKDFPDIVPILSLKCALSNKKIEIINIARLRIKECDRLKATVQELSKLGFDLIEKEDAILINSQDKINLKNKNDICLSSHNDHRIAMLIAIASTVCQNNIILDDASCVKKSYPNFWEDFVSLGGEIKEIF